MTPLTPQEQQIVDKALSEGLKLDGCSCVPDFDVHDCCQLHDALYLLPGGTRAEADRIMRKCIHRKPGWRHWLLGWIYWAAVRALYWPWVWVRGGNSKWTR